MTNSQDHMASQEELPVEISEGGPSMAISPRAHFTWTGIAQQLIHALQSTDLGLPHRKPANGPEVGISSPGADEVEDEAGKVGA